MLANQADADLKARSLSISPWLRAEGTVDRPLNYTGLNLDVALRGPDLQMLGAALQLPLPATPPYMLTGKLTHQDEYERWNLVTVRAPSAAATSRATSAWSSTPCARRSSPNSSRTYSTSTTSGSRSAHRPTRNRAKPHPRGRRTSRLVKKPLARSPVA
jgi:hypothetical protein